MPAVVRPDPPLPMSVAIASKVFGAEAHIGLIRHFREHPSSTQAAAGESLDLPRWVVSNGVAVLVQAAVLVVDVEPSGPRPGQYRTDQQRVQELLDAIAAYVADRAK